MSITNKIASEDIRNIGSIDSLADWLTHWSDDEKDLKANIRTVTRAIDGNFAALVEVALLAERVTELECAEDNAGADI